YRERAAGGVGLVIVETTCVDAPAGKTTAYQLVIDDDKFIPGLTRLAETIHQHGARTVLQLQHGGRGTKSSITGIQPVAPSPIPMPYGTQVGYEGEMPRELTVSEIKGIVRKFAQGAQRAKTAGFDGVEIHSTGYYLVAQFLSSTANVRQDEYGGSLANRARFLLEIIRGVREVVGRDYPLLCKISAMENGPGAGLNPVEGQQVAQMAEEAGADALEIAGMGWGISPRQAPPTAERPGGLIPFAQGMKRVVGIPIIVGSRMTPELGEKVLQEGKADFIAIGKGLIADPDLPSKAASGRVEEIRPCIGCLRCVDNETVKGRGIMCSVNAAAGKERQFSEPKLAGRSKRVFVVGGGPAGMEAARVAALRGHEVTLFEKQAKLGGQLLQAIVPPHKDNLRNFIDYLTTQMAMRGVDIRLGVEANAELISQARPDAVILATGVTFTAPRIPGIDRANVVSAKEVLSGAGVGDTVAIVGGGLVGCETAEYLVQQGKKVTILEMLDEVAGRMPLALRNLLLARLADKGVAVLTGIQCRELTEDGLVISSKEGEVRTIRANNVVLASGDRSNRVLVEELRDTVPVHAIGDCVEPRGIAEAVADGYTVGVSI
ncbi:MAG: FAD-dependent oxidoreductase, partial [Chloroflexi bacterium]|nr:FAD-dependent oxidoreductase [Chloroflexota bacterium]